MRRKRSFRRYKLYVCTYMYTYAKYVHLCAGIKRAFAMTNLCVRVRVRVCVYMFHVCVCVCMCSMCVCV